MNKTERKIWYRTGLEFFLVFLLCAIILTGYDAIRNKELGKDALKQKQNYIFRLLAGKENKEARESMYMLNDSTDDNFDGNFKNQYYSYHIWTSEGEEIFSTQNTMLFPVKDNRSNRQIEIKPEDIFSKEECTKIYQACKENGLLDLPPKYRFIYEGGTDEDGTYQIAKIILEQLTWVRNTEGTKVKGKEDPWLETIRSWKSTKGDKRYLQTDAETVLEWNREDTVLTAAMYSDDVSLRFPYLHDSYADWEIWTRNEWLQEEAKYQEVKEALAKEGAVGTGNVSGSFVQKGEVRYLISKNENTYYIQIRSVGYPILLAMENLKWTYLVLLLILAICTGFVGVQQIRTEQKKVRIEKERLDFVNGMAHEIKTPLAILKMCGDNLRVAELEFKKEYYLATMDQKTAEINELIRRMMYLSQMNSSHFLLSRKETSIQGLINQALDQQKPFIKEKEIRLERKEKSSIWSVDGAYFGQLISCLLTNAVNYTSAQGRIVIELDEQHLSIENEGIQIVEEEKNHIFELFYQSGQKSDGVIKRTGFGLYLTKQVAELHHMECFVEDGILGPRFVIKK